MSGMLHVGSSGVQRTFASASCATECACFPPHSTQCLRTTGTTQYAERRSRERGERERERLGGRNYICASGVIAKPCKPCIAIPAWYLGISIERLDRKPLAMFESRDEALTYDPSHGDCADRHVRLNSVDALAPHGNVGHDCHYTLRTYKHNGHKSTDETCGGDPVPKTTERYKGTRSGSRQRQRSSQESTGPRTKER